MPTRLLLIVEDDPTIQELLADLFEGEGYLVTLAGNGHEALTILESVTPSAMIVDLVMPVMDGVELLMELERLGMTLPCVVATAGQDPETRLAGLPIKATVAKPFDLADLGATVDEVCR